MSSRQLRKVLLVASASFMLLNGCSDDQIERYGSALPEEAASATATPPQRPEYRLRLYQLHTHESLDVVYRRGDDYLEAGVQQLNHLLRDYRTGEDASYPTAEFDLLHELLSRLGRPDAVIGVVCGYRTPRTNQLLRARGLHTGVAERSQHMLSRAIDIRIPGVSTEILRDAALSLHRGGVGYYPDSGFVHVDVGPVRQWAFGVSRYHRRRVLTKG